LSAFHSDKQADFIRTNVRPLFGPPGAFWSRSLSAVSCASHISAAPWASCAATGNGISKVVFTILSAVSENERDRIRERVRETKRHRASQQLYNGGKRPFGYDVIDGRLVPNAHGQAALARGKALRDEGKSYREIAQTWASEFGRDDDLDSGRGAVLPPSPAP
jgi:hypothetical protein